MVTTDAVMGVTKAIAGASATVCKYTSLAKTVIIPIFESGQSLSDLIIFIIIIYYYESAAFA